MKKIMGDKDEKVVMFDVDDTLVIWDTKHSKPGKNKIAIVDPNDGETRYLTPHKAHIRLMKHFYHRGYYVVVWSAAGGKWARSVTKAIGVEKYVHDTMAKMLKYVDDLDIKEWSGNRIYLKHEE